MGNVKTESKNTVPTADKQTKPQGEERLVCLVPCQVRINGKILPFDRGQLLTVTDDCVYPAVCFKTFKSDD